MKPTIQPRAILFDFDGTLADSYAAITASVNHVRACRELPPLPEAEVRRFVGRGLEHLLEDTVPGCEAALDVKRYHAHHPSVLARGTKLLPGVADTLAKLRKVGFQMGVCSNKPRHYTVELLELLGIGPFEVVLGPEDVAEVKPAPDMLRQALARLGVGPDQALYVGDMAIDVRTARAAGVTVWVIATGSEERSVLVAAGPDRMLDHFEELQALVHV